MSERKLSKPKELWVRVKVFFFHYSPDWLRWHTTWKHVERETEKAGRRYFQQETARLQKENDELRQAIAEAQSEKII